MSPLSSVCLLGEMGAAAWGRTPSVRLLWQSIRFASSSRLMRRKPARMALSRDVAKPSSDPSRQLKKAPPQSFRNNPFGGMNQTRARLTNRPASRSEAELKRSSLDGNGKDSLYKSKEGSNFRALKMQVVLSPIPYSRRNRIKEKIASVTSFDQFQLLPQVRDAVYRNAFPNLTEVSPTPIQRVAIPALLRPPIESEKNNTAKKKTSEGSEEDMEMFNFDQFLLAAETGTGKTLAYLLPVINWIKRAEMVEKETEMMENEKKQKEEVEKKKENLFELDAPEVVTKEHSNVARPRAVILVPTAELVEQVGKLAKQLSHTVKYRSAMISSAYTPRRITNNLFKPAGIDILISTPHLLTSIARTNPYILSRVTHLVVDEADSLFDKSFSPLTSSIVERTAPSLQQMILCSATIPRSLDTLLKTKFPKMKRLITPNLHAIPRRVQLGVIDVDKDPYRGNKKLACADIIWSIGKAGETRDFEEAYPASLFPESKHIIVFVNERETTEEVTQFLNEKGIHAVALSRDTPDQRKDEILEEFTHARPPPTPKEVKDAQQNKKSWFSDSVPFVRDQDPRVLGPQKWLRDTKVLVTTDLASRGIDTVAVRNVVLYDVPHTTIDFIHRLGRTGRMGRRGRGIVLVSKKDRKDVVKEVREAMFMGQALI
ncbi:ATP-dependent RNA helicase MRH4, mitochondrial [Paracoccidioides brasiliensis Pb18]|uniref:RNA helicase n=1 Tax=Paracoccidioides brasiliensis (strain Pb18) TaxID=502780 RepID=C1GD72_PARBD|nr:ATP-dependent RNA helicase MRH4, mitochondrial [Paracoccidioides brasiliensis Pb18]EEH49129.2 ATP-dependent RNA helicase MRH4, mitochondrial [Paracoccidioides brasiliensis Pb18]